MPTNVEVTKNMNENAVNLIRRFTKRVKGSGILSRMRSIAYHERQISDFKKKKRAIKSIEIRKERERLQKLGKIVEK